MTIISNYIYKQRKSSSVFKRAFLLKIIVRSKEMSIYKNCFKCSLRFYTVFLLDSTRCMEYVRLNRFKYDVLGLIVVQLEILSLIHIHLEAELEDVFEK